MIPTILAPKVSRSFVDQLYSVDRKLNVAFNCDIERWQIFRKDRRGQDSWVMTVQGDNGEFRTLDNRTIRKLREMDIIARWGSVANYEKNLDKKLAKWKADEQSKMDHEMKWDAKDDKVLWQRAMENAKSGIVNDLPEERDKKIISYRKNEVSK